MSSDLAVSASHVSKVFELGLSGRTKSFAQIIGERVRHPIKGGTRRERFHALDDVSFDVARGETVGIIGSNGAGKSTLLKILSRVTPPSAGSIDLVGTVGSLLEVGTGFHPELTGMENIFVNGSILGMSKQNIQRRLDEIVEFSEVEQFLATPVKRWSSGMRVRLAFAVAAHLEPEILIVDEVLSVGDAAFQAKCLEKMRKLASEDGRSVLYVSHQLTTVEHLCPRSIWLHHGKVAFDGPTNETMSNYLRQFPHAKAGDIAGVYDLASATREGPYKRRLTRLDLRPSDGAPSDIVRMGEAVAVDITVEGLDALTQPYVNVSVGSRNVPILFRMTSRMQRLVANHPRKSREVIALKIPSIPLTPGEYQLEIQLKDMNTTVDFVRSIEFTVVAADVLGQGYRFDGQYGFHEGYMVVPWQWEIRPDDGPVVDNLAGSAATSGAADEAFETSPASQLGTRGSR